MDGFEKEYIKNKLGKKKGKTPSKQPENVFEDFAKKIAEIISNKEPIAAKIIREQSNKTLNKTNYLMGFQNDKKTVSKQNQSNIVKPTFPAFQKGFVSHGAIDYDFAIMESKLEQENVHHENHGHDSHSGDSDIKKRVEPSPAPSGIPVASTASVNIAGVPYIYFSPFTKKLSGYEFQCNFNYNVVINSGLIYMNISENGADYVLISPNTIFYKDGFIFYTVSNWKVVSFGDNEGSPEVFDISTNPSTDTATIPTTGWTPSITITAA